MTVVVVSDCPINLKGDLTKWLFEINSGVFVGNMSARVREALWVRICDSIKSGKATMVFRTNGEQHLSFWVHNTTWEPVDYDGITLMRKPFPEMKKKLVSDHNEISFKNKQKYLNKKIKPMDEFVMIDIETTGLSVLKDEIIQLGGIKVKNDLETDSFLCFVKTQKKISQDITNLTGITNELVNTNGLELKEAISKIIDFIGNDILLSYNINFDISFLQNACRKTGIPIRHWKTFDVKSIAKRKLPNLCDYKLCTVAESLGIEEKQKHQALSDVRLLLDVYVKLNKIPLSDV